MTTVWKRLAYIDEVVPVSTFNAKGTLLVGFSSGLLNGLGIGDTSDVLTVVAGTAAWAPPGTPGLHAITHKASGDDEILLNELGEPTGPVEFAGKQATNLVLHAVADVAARLGLSASVAQIAFQTDELAPYVCTALS